MSQQKILVKQVIQSIDKEFDRVGISYQTIVREETFEKRLSEGSEALCVGYHIALGNGLIVLFLYLKNGGEKGYFVEAEFMMSGVELKSLIKKEDESVELFAGRIQEKIKEAELKNLFKTA